MSAPQALLVSTLSGLAITLTANAQVVTTKVLVTGSDAIRLVGDRPAMRGGLVAFMGEEQPAGIGRDTIAFGPLDGSAPFTPILWENDPVPWLTGWWWVGFGNPNVWDGKVYFDGLRTDNGSSLFGDGYLSAVGTNYSKALPFTMGTPAHGPLGLATGTFFTLYDGTIQIALPPGMALPGGGTVPGASFTWSGVLEGFSQENGLVILSPRVTHSQGMDGGVYTWDPVTKQFGLIANYLTDVPGKPGTKFKQFYGVDTDGATVAMSGVADFGEVSGTFTAPVGSNGQGPFTTLAVTGQMSPFGLPYASGGYTAVTPETVFFSAGVGPVSSPEFAVLVACGGEVYPVFKSGDLIDGKKMFDGRVNARAADGKDLVMWARYEDPTSPFGVNTMLLHIHVECPGACAADCDASGSLDIDDFICFQTFFALGDPSADCDADGVLTIDDFICFQTLFALGC
jgi:hypothetical protein